MEAGKKSDAQTMAMTSGAPTSWTWDGRGETDVAVSTLVSVRDRVIQSYEDIMKMPI
jgi:flagellar hook-basal body complex protein FliE